MNDPTTFLTLALAVTLTEQAQTLDQRIDKYVTQKSIDTFLVYSFPCSGGIPFDSCQYDEPHYLIWRKNGIFFLKRFDYCQTYKILALDTFNPLTFYLNNKKTIDKEQIRQPTYYEVKKNKNTFDTLLTTSTVDHSCYHKFHLPLTKKPKYKYADTYDLDFKIFDNGKENIYYSYNQKTKLKALIDLTTTLVQKLDLDKRLEGD